MGKDGNTGVAPVSSKNLSEGKKRPFGKDAPAVMKRSEEEDEENDAVEPEEIRALELDNRGSRDTWLGLLTGVVLYAICHILVREKVEKKSFFL